MELVSRSVCIQPFAWKPHNSLRLQPATCCERRDTVLRAQGNRTPPRAAILARWAHWSTLEHTGAPRSSATLCMENLAGSNPGLNPRLLGRKPMSSRPRHVTAGLGG
jgi:hypothetical protein